MATLADALASDLAGVGFGTLEGTNGLRSNDGDTLVELVQGDEEVTLVVDGDEERSFSYEKGFDDLTRAVASHLNV